MKRFGVATLCTFLIGTALSQPGTWRSTITGIDLPQSAARIVDAKIIVAAARTLETVAAENALSGRCHGTELIETTKPSPAKIVDLLENGLSKQGFTLENLPGGDDARYSLAARRGGRLIILNVNALENGHMVIAWCALEPVVGITNRIPSHVTTGRYACRYTLGTKVIQAGTITVISGSTYLWSADRSPYQYVYSAGRVLWRSGQFSDATTYRDSRYEQDASGNPRFTMRVQTSGGSLNWTCPKST